MMLRHLKASGLLSFGPTGIDLPLRPLNVLIGPNGSGKSNFLELLALIRAAPSRLTAPIKETGGVAEWLWQGQGASVVADLEALVGYPGGPGDLRHGLQISAADDRLLVVAERVAYNGSDKGPAYQMANGVPTLRGEAGHERYLRADTLRTDESVLSQVRDKEQYPALFQLQSNYERIRLYRNWTFGTGAAVRRRQATTAASDVLADSGDNLALVLNRIRNSLSRRQLQSALATLIDGATDLHIDIRDGNVQLLLEESAHRPAVPASRLSDGTLRYLYLVAALLQPDPPPLVAIEEPELGLHPDLMHEVAKLLRSASERTQVVVTTHSRELVDALSDDPEAVVVCERVAGESRFRRLDAGQLAAWLSDYTLGRLWADGELGGNRW